MRRLNLTKSAQADLKSIARFTQSRWGLRQRNAYLKRGVRSSVNWPGTR